MYLVAWEFTNHRRNFTTCDNKSDMLSLKEHLSKCANVNRIYVSDLLEYTTREDRYKALKCSLSSVYGMVVNK